MKAWVYSTKKCEYGFINLKDVPEPKNKDYQVIIKVKGVSVCGTDENLLKGEFSEIHDGIIPGHEFWGEVVQIGASTNDILRKRGLHEVKKGSLIASESHYNVEGFQEEGIIGLWGPEISKGKYLPPINGAYSEYCAVPAECIYPISEELISGFLPSLIEAAGNDALVAQFLKENNVKNVGIVGSGPHGLYAQIFAKHFGINKIAAFETDSFRIDFARNLQVSDKVFNSNDQNLDEKVYDFTEGKGFDAMVDLAGKYREVLDMCIKYTKKRGILVLFGLYEAPDILLDGKKPNDIIFGREKFEFQVDSKKISVAGITGRTPEIWKYLINTLENDKKLKKLLMAPVTHMGTLNNLGPDTINKDPEILKRAYAPFEL